MTTSGPASTTPTPPSDLIDFIAGLPKVELHVHHVGSASPRIVAELAARHPGTVPADPARLAEFFTFRDFAHFIELYLATVALIETADDIRLLTYEVATDMAAQNIRYAELTCTPYTSVLGGIPIQGYIEAIEDARIAAERDHGIRLRWIFDIPGEIGPNAAEESAKIAIDHGPDALIAFGLGGPEIGSPRPQ
ncbi:MAG: adenosine deaminase, partial [Nakamurella sp.]